MSSVITVSQVRRQLAAMGCGYFDIGILRPDGRMLLCEALTFGKIEQAIQRLRRENARGAHIFVRPHGVHALSLVDDLGVDAIARMTDAGFEPAFIVETSPQNFQVWLNHGRTLDRSMSSYASKELAKRFGGDLSSADWRHFGRLAGFTNRKPVRLLPNGLGPFVRLRQWEGRVYDAAEEFLRELKSLAEKAVPERASRVTSRPTANGNPVQSLSQFHRSARYDGDLHRADMAWALQAASRGFSEQQIRDEILNARDLSKKGRLQRQVNYATRTAIKALSNCRAATLSARGFATDEAAQPRRRTAQK
jgi:RepB DNA-primase from phage plasmid